MFKGKLKIFCLVFGICVFGFFVNNVSVAVERPQKMKGVYLNVWTMNSPGKFQRIAKQTKKHGLNTLVCDFEGSNRTYLRNLKYAKELGLYCIARIVVFEDGVGATFKNVKEPVNWNKKQNWAKEAEKIGFDEIQFDYIRFADRGSGTDKKKDIIEEFLKESKDNLKIPVGIDVFGSVAYQPRHAIGQDLNRLANIIDVVSPMLYPSHFHLDKKRMSQPYETILEGCLMAKKQLWGRPVKLVPFIQGFALRLSYSKMSLKDYIIAQIRAVEEAGADGFFVWNAGNEYKVTWQALKELGSS